MEALLIIFAEIIFACLMPFFAAIGAFFALILEALWLMFSDPFGRRKARRKRPTQPSGTDRTITPAKPLFSRKVIHWGAGLLGGVAALAMLASVVFFDPLLRSILTKAGDRAGIAINYADSSGSLLLGKVALTDLTMVRASADGLAFDLAVDRVEADVALFSLLSSEPRIQFAGVDGVAGFVTPPQKKDGQEQPDGRPKERKAFRADRVEVANIDLNIRPRGADAYDLKIASGDVAPFRSGLAMFDLLFRSNLKAEIAGQPLEVSTRQISENGRETYWDFYEVEVDQLRLILPKAPLTWLSGGTATVRVEDSWSLDDNIIDMDWLIAMDGIDVAAPETAGRAERLLAGGLAKAVDRQGGNADFKYRLELGPEQVAALRAGDLSAFWDVVLSGFVKPIFTRTSDTTEEVTDDVDEDGRIRGAIDALRERLGRDTNE